jgi:hypothetical protein
VHLNNLLKLKGGAILLVVKTHGSSCVFIMLREFCNFRLTALGTSFGLNLEMPKLKSRQKACDFLAFISIEEQNRTAACF